MQDEHEELFEGFARGGPLDGTEQQSRFPKGFLLVDKANNRCWIYDFAGGEFVVREEEGAELVSDPTASHNRFRAAEERSYDVRAYDTAAMEVKA
jgi:hypothetical protein